MYATLAEKAIQDALVSAGYLSILLLLLHYFILVAHIYS